MSYHDVIFVELNLRIKTKLIRNKIEIRDFKNIDTDRLLNECRQIRWENLLTSNCIEKKVQVLVDKMLSLYDKFVPIKHISNKRNPCPWIRVENKNLMKERDVMYKRYVRTKDRQIWAEYRELRHRVKTNCKRCKKYIFPEYNKC